MRASELTPLGFLSSLPSWTWAERDCSPRGVMRAALHCRFISCAARPYAAECEPAS